MADTKISALANHAAPIDADYLPIVDSTGPTTKRVTVANLRVTIPHDHTTADGSGVLTNDEHDGYMEITEIAAPGNPAAGKQRIYIDSTSHKAVRKNSAGAVTDLEGGGGTPPPESANLVIGLEVFN